MCPACIGSTLLLLSGAGSAGGLALIATRALRPRPPAAHAEYSEHRSLQADEEPRPGETGARDSTDRLPVDDPA